MWGLKTALSRATLLGAFASAPSSAFLIGASSSRVASTTSTTSSTRSYRTTTALPAVQYLLHYDYVPDILEKRAPHREGHLALAQQMIDDGKCLAGGPVGRVGMEVPGGALFLFSDAAAAEQFAQDDPYMAAGLITKHSIQEWNVVVEAEK